MLEVSPSKFKKKKSNWYHQYGQVIDGFETLDIIEKVPVGQKNRPLSDIKIEKVIIHANPMAS